MGGRGASWGKGAGPSQGDPRQSWGDGGGGKAEPSRDRRTCLRRLGAPRRGGSRGRHCPCLGSPESGDGCRAPEALEPPYLKSVQHRGQSERPADPAARRLALGLKRERVRPDRSTSVRRISSAASAKVPLMPGPAADQARALAAPREERVGQGRVSRGGRLPKVLRVFNGSPGAPASSLSVTAPRALPPATSLLRCPRLKAGLLGFRPNIPESRCGEARGLPAHALSDPPTLSHPGSAPGTGPALTPPPQPRAAATLPPPTLQAPASHTGMPPSSPLPGASGTFCPAPLSCASGTSPRLPRP